MKQSDLLTGILAVLVGVCLWGVSALAVYKDAQSVLVPWLQTALAAPISYVRGVDQLFNSITQLQQLSDQNQALQLKLADLTSQIAQTSELEEQNTWLRSQLALGETKQPQKLLAKVIRHNYSLGNAEVMAIVDSGENVNIGDWVVASGYIVGRVVETQAEVFTIKGLPGLDGMLVDLAGKGIGRLEASAGGSIKIKDIAANLGVAVNDWAKLTGEGTQKLESYLLGTVESVRGTAADTVWEIDLEIPITIFDLENVFVIKNG